MFGTNNLEKSTPAGVWHDLVKLVGPDAMLLFGWLHRCGTDPTGLFFASPDVLERELGISRDRVLAALAVLSKTDDAQTLGARPEVICYDRSHFVGYVHGWNRWPAETAPRLPVQVHGRINFVKQMDDCRPVAACLAELVDHPMVRGAQLGVVRDSGV